MTDVDIFMYILCLLLSTRVHSFNLDYRLPIIKKGSLPHSYFGYSVALHKEIANGNHITWLLVGAPRDQNLQPGTNRSGALWKCPFTTNEHDCEQVVTDGMRDEHGRYESYDTFLNSGELSKPYYDQEIKDDQWMGVTVRSEGPGKSVLVCAHRYVKKGSRGNTHLGQGLCYTLTQELDFNWYYEPCHGRPVAAYHEQWGLCQAGTNGLLTGDDEVVLGAPGSITWKGALFAQNSSKDWLNKDKTVYHTPVKENSSTEKYSYLGFSVAYGKFVGGRMSYVAGAPRSQGVGEVFFFKKKQRGEAIMKEQLKFSGDLVAASFGYEIAAVDFNNDGWDDLVVGAPFYHRDMLGGAIYVYMNKKGGLTKDTSYILVTGQMGECRFGFSLANLGDINHDGYQDLAVGAPYEGKGVIYIYHGSQQGFVSKEAQKIVSEDLPGIPPVTFGYSLSGGIDVDNNGYTDLLVGCYANDKVYLLRSRPIVNIYTRVLTENLTDINPAEQHCPDDPSANTTCFSFKACFRVESLDQLRRASPLIKYEIEAETFNDVKVSRVYFKNGQVGRNNVVKGDIKLYRHSSRDYHCSPVLVYLKKESKPQGRFDIQSPIEFKLTYSLGAINPVYREGVSVPEMGEYPVLNQKEAVKHFSATFLKNCSSKICESNLRVYASVNLTTGRDNLPQVTLGVDERIVMDIDIENDGDPAYMAALIVKNSPGLVFNAHSTVSSREIHCKVINETVVRCFLGNPFHGTGKVTLQYSPSLPFEVTRIAFNLSTTTTSNNLMEGSRTIPISVAKKINLSIRGVSKPEQVKYSGEVVGESAMKYLEDVGLSVKHKYFIENFGPYRAEDLKIRVHWPYQVENGRPQGKWLLYLTKHPEISRGFCRVKSDHINILGLKSKESQEEPQTTEAPTTEAPTTEAPTTTTSRSGGSTIIITNRTEIITTTNTKKTYKKKYHAGEKSSSSSSSHKSSYEAGSSHSRTKREQEQVVLPVALTGEDGKKTNTVFMKCGTAKCIEIECIISKIDNEETVSLTIHSRLWNSTLVEDYANVHMVEIESKGEIVIDDHLNIQQDDLANDEAFAVTTAIPELPSDAQKGVPIWIIVVAVLAGLLLLVIIVFIFYKCGFFKRKKPDPTLAGNLEKAGLNGEYS